MKKLFYSAAIAALALTACAKVETVDVNQGDPLSFGVYIPNSTTKAGAVGLMNDALLQSSGFGVFAYHHDASAGNTAYNRPAIAPNFMYNQQVTYSAPNWTYSPVKYWPNEHGSAAASDVVDRVSFFAYAPYVSAGSGTAGIKSLTTNTTTGDPKVTYTVAAKPAENVDLVWAVAGADQSYTSANNETVTVAAGLPFLNLVKPKTDHKINFLFKHATAKLVLQVKGVFDQGSKDSYTKITISSVTIKGSFARTGVLNLNNTSANVAKWETKEWDVAPTPPATIGESTITVNSTNNLNASLIDAGNVAFATQPTGVTAVYQDLIADSGMFNLIPGDITEVVIDYFVTTDDNKLSGGYSRVQNTIKHRFASPLTLNNNYQYTLNLDLGMTTVKVSASVSNWDNGATETIDLPANVTPAP